MKDFHKKVTTKWYVYMIYILLISTMAMGISFSRFSTVIVNTGPENTSAPAIEFSTWIMNHNATDVDLTGIKPGDTKTITVWVKNSDEDDNVSTYNQNFTLEIETTGNLPLVFTLKQGGTEIPLNHPTQKQFISNTQSFTGNSEETKNYTLEVTWPAASKQYNYKDEIDYLQLSLRAAQS